MWPFKQQEFTCSNGATTQWSSKESVTYTKDNNSVDVWVDWRDPKGEARVIYKSHITNWSSTNNSTSAAIGEQEKEIIVNCIIEYLHSNDIEEFSIV